MSEALDKHMAVFSLFVPGTNGGCQDLPYLSLADVSEHLNMPKATCSRLLNALVEHEFLAHDGRDRYTLGLFCYEVTRAHARAINRPAAAMGGWAEREARRRDGEAQSESRHRILLDPHRVGAGGIGCSEDAAARQFEGLPGGLPVR